MATKIILPNGCSCSVPGVSPANWKTQKASIKKDWFIQYRFYDPNFEKPKQRIVKGMNEYKVLAERQAVTERLLANEMRLLEQLEYNPITGYSLPEPEQQSRTDISPKSTFIEALTAVRDRLSVCHDIKLDIKSMIKYLTIAVRDLHMDLIYVSEIRRKHIKLLLEHCYKVNKRFSNNRYNKYRTHLQICFNELLEMEATDVNPVVGLRKKKVTTKMRETLSRKERAEIDAHLRKNNYAFWRFMRIYFHSGCRETELLSVKKEDADLSGQRFKITVKKGRSAKEEYRTIKDIALPLWIEVLQGAKAGMYLFSEGLVPAKRDKPIRREQITRRWRLHVKNKLGITADFYSLKHSNLDEIADRLSVYDASQAAGHTSTAITLKHYLVNEREREHERLKKVDNTFA